jgi:hypothetical protein
MLHAKNDSNEESKEGNTLKLGKFLAVPMLLFGSECRTLSKQEMRRVKVAEMGLLRATDGWM